MRLCPRVTILATSREILRVDGEFVYRVPPLEVPAADADEPDRILAHSAVELFVARARRWARTSHRRRDLADDRRDLPAPRRHTARHRVCRGPRRRARGSAGGRWSARSLRAADAGRRTALPRHRTLRAALDWSYELLPERGSAIIACLGCLPGGFTLDAAVASRKTPTATRRRSWTASRTLSRSRSSRSIYPRRLPAGLCWKRFGLTRLRSSPSIETASAARNHAGYFRDLLRYPRWARRRLSNDDLTRRIREIDNIRAALDWCFSADGDVAIGVHFTAIYAPVWLHLSLIGECRDRCERALRGSIRSLDWMYGCRWSCSSPLQVH